ncbi:hypothetical protein Dsin_021156 [Dipteronia sinensis]|uniref:Uncharacterized protein n=1 Tax=Dipteronia sinensis TaxID=43782 RepID=A0AAE0AAW3_9ROSI|nr:hypothetical protein Dsin_021156 [Dipteronia sinensis]
MPMINFFGSSLALVPPLFAELYDFVRGFKPKFTWIKIIWRRFIPPKNSFLFWRLLLGNLPTDDNLRKRGFCAPSAYLMCLRNEETTHHLFYGCSFATQLWCWLASHFNTSLPLSGTIVVLWNTITSKSFSSQIYNMWISSSIQVVYDIWKARNDHRFRNKAPFVDRIISNLKAKILLNCSICPGYMHSAYSSLMNKLGVKPHLRIAHCITSCVWHPPSYPWIKANTDGCSKGNSEDGACSDVFRNGNSSFIGGFSHNLGVCTSFVAEMQAALHVICFAFDRGWKWLWLETNCMAVISYFSNPNYSPSWQLHNLWLHSKHLINQMHFVITYTFREGNMVADILANEGLKVSDYVWWDNLPSCIVKQFHLDS